MGLVSGTQREALLSLAQEATKQTSFSRLLSQAPTIYDYQRSSRSLIEDLSGAVAPAPGTPAAKAKKATEIHVVSKLPPGKGFNPAGYYHQFTISFALGPQGSNTPIPGFVTDEEKDERDAWGTVWESDLTNPRRSCVYLVKYEFTQLRVEPLASGVILHFTRPVGWVWVDGQTVDIPFQVVSNPLVIIRQVRSPATPAVNNTGFSVNVKRRYF